MSKTAPECDFSFIEGRLDDSELKEYLKKLADRMTKGDKTVCDVNMCYYSAEYAIRYAGLLKGILNGYDIDVKTMTAADLQRMSVEHKSIFALCSKECAVYSRLAESFYERYISPLVTRKPDTANCILCTECCTCNEFPECDIDARDLRKQVSKLGEALQKVVAPICRIAGRDELTAQIPFADMVETK